MRKGATLPMIAPMTMPPPQASSIEIATSYSVTTSSRPNCW
jgi:hypothetical protein